MTLPQVLRRYLRICEAYEAGGYSAGVWRRWWANDQTGVVLPVDLHEDHDAYFFAHLDKFFTPNELTQLPDPDDHGSYDDPESEIQNSHDAILVAAYTKGWHAVIYDGNNRSLSLRTSRHLELRGLRKIVRKITAELPVTMLVIDIGTQSHRLDIDEIARFIKFGRLPPV